MRLLIARFLAQKQINAHPKRIVTKDLCGVRRFTSKRGLFFCNLRRKSQDAATSFAAQLVVRALF